MPVSYAITARGTRLRSVGRPLADEEGSIIPLALGFFLIAVLFVGGGVAYADVFTKQRDLQAVCDGAAVAAANNIDRGALHAGSGDVAAVPLARADGLVRAYLGRDHSGAAISATTALSTDGRTISVRCRVHNDVAFGALIGKGGGVDQTAYASAEARLSR